MKTGDIVRVKEWDLMAAEHGVNEEGAIKGIAFAPYMKSVCGAEGIIKTCADAFVTIIFDPVYGDGANFWVFAKETVEVIKEAPEAPPAPKAQETNLDVLYRELQTGKEEKVKELWEICNEDLYECVELLAWLKAPADEDDLK